MATAQNNKNRTLWKLATVGFLVSLFGFILVWLEINLLGKILLFVGWGLVVGAIITQRVQAFIGQDKK